MDSHEEVDIDDSSGTCSVLDDILLTNSDQLVSQPEEIDVYRNNEGEVISIIV